MEFPSIYEIKRPWTAADQHILANYTQDSFKNSIDYLYIFLVIRSDNKTLRQNVLKNLEEQLTQETIDAGQNILLSEKRLIILFYLTALYYKEKRIRKLSIYSKMVGIGYHAILNAKETNQDSLMSKSPKNTRNVVGLVTACQELEKRQEKMMFFVVMLLVILSIICFAILLHRFFGLTSWISQIWYQL